MGDNNNKFKITMTVSKETGGEIFYKADGERFESNSTIKMNVETTYVFFVTIKPPQVLEGASLLGDRLSIKEVSYDNEKARYKMPWPATGVSTTKRAKRENMPLLLELKGLGSVKLVLQAKFYKARDIQHATWGTALHQIELDCEAKPGLSAVDVVKEAYH